MTQEKSPEIKLKVMEALQEEAYKGIVRIDSQTMRQINVHPGDVIEIEGGKITLGIIDRAYPTDIGQQIIRMDGILRRNAKTGIGESVKIRRADIKEAKSLTIAPAQKGVMIQANPEIFKRGLLGRPVVKGDIVVLGGARSRRQTMTGSPFEDIFDVFEQNFMGNFGFGGLKFIVVDTMPKQPVIITESTVITISSKAVEVSEDQVLDVTYEDIGGLQDEIKKIREMVELPLKHPEIFERLGIEPPKGVLLHGPPGTGKTLLAKAVATESDSNFILVNGPELTCITGDTELLTNPSGRKKVETIFKHAQETGNVVRKDNAHEIILLKEKIKVFSLDENFKIIPNNIKAIKKVQEKPTLILETKKKNKLTLTNNHPLATLNTDGELIWKRVDELKPSDYIAIASHIKASDKNPEVNYWENLDHDHTFVLIDGNETKLKHASDYLKITGLKHAKLKSNIKRAKFIKPIKEITPKFAELLGAILSDGYIGFDEICISSKDEKLLDYYKLYFTNSLGITDDRITVKYGKNGKAGKTVVYSTALAELLTKGFGLPRHKKPLDFKIPEWLFKCNKETIAAFIKGYYYGDGCQGWIKSKTPSPALFSANKEILKDIQILFLNLGITTTLHSNKTGYGNILYKLNVQSRESKQKFYDLLRLDFKKEVFEVWLNNLRNQHSSETLPNISSLLHRLKTNLELIYNKEIPEQHFEPIISGRFNLTTRTAEKLYKIFLENSNKVKLDKVTQEIVNKDLENLKNIIYGDLRWDKIMKISQGEIQPVYDISMDKYTNFFAGSPLTLMHNSKFYGDTEKRIRAIFEKAEKEAPSIIFFDEIDSIAPKREETYGEVERRMVAQLLATMDGLKSRGKVVVIAATNRPNSLDPALRRPGRFDREIEIGVPTKQGRLNILKIHTRNMPLTKNVNLDKIASITHGFVGADIAALAKEAAMNVLRKVLPDINFKEDTQIPKEVLNKLQISQEDFKEALKLVRPSAMREVLIEAPHVEWKDIGGLEELKQELKEAVEWPLKYPHAFTRLGIKPPKGILMYGPPGTGKTLLAKAIATESEANFISIKGPELISKWVGESEKGVRKIFEKARQASPCIIFFDELDAIASTRGFELGAKVTERMVNQLLTEMDGIEELHDVIIIAATNRPDMIDSALLRPGRFDRIISTMIPDEDARFEIFKIHTKTMPLGKDVDLKKLSKQTKFYVGADIEGVCREAGLLALREDMKIKEVGMKHFEDAVKKVKASIKEEDVKVYDQAEDGLRTARSAAIAKKDHMSYFG